MHISKEGFKFKYKGEKRRGEKGARKEQEISEE